MSGIYQGCIAIFSWLFLIAFFGASLQISAKVFSAIFVFFEIFNFTVNFFGLIAYSIAAIKDFLSDGKRFRLCCEILTAIIAAAFLLSVTGVGIYYGAQITLEKDKVICKFDNSTIHGENYIDKSTECGIIFLIFAITLFIFVFTCPIWFKLLITRVKHMGHEHQTAVQRVHSTRPFPPPPYYDNQTLPSYDNVMQST
uniref:MARVEL domain-containing protein n=1 Tax=Panagrolaimus sp. JU765 TaxID=591449 RepID=A0AC34RQW5_9BILA